MTVYLYQQKQITMKNKIEKLLKMLKTEDLVSFAKDSQSDEIIGFILNELEGRMEESQFIQLCETL